MNQTLTIGYSPCPNDTFIFYALVHGKVRVPGIEFRERLEDVETLNRLALEGTLDLTKISYHALGHLREQYALLRSGSALGRGCGPLIVARPGTHLADLKQGTIAIPGRLTTAFLLLGSTIRRCGTSSVMTFDRIMDAVATGEAAAGLIIHESRFTYPLSGCKNCWTWASGGSSIPACPSRWAASWAGGRSDRDAAGGRERHPGKPAVCAGSTRRKCWTTAGSTARKWTSR